MEQYVFNLYVGDYYDRSFEGTFDSCDSAMAYMIEKYCRPYGIAAEGSMLPEYDLQACPVEAIRLELDVKVVDVFCYGFDPSNPSRGEEESQRTIVYSGEIAALPKPHEYCLKFVAYSFESFDKAKEAAIEYYRQKQIEKIDKVTQSVK